MVIREVGDTGWLLDLAPSGDAVEDAARVLALAATVRGSPAGQLVADVVPAATTVLVTCAPERHGALRKALADLTIPAPGAPPASTEADSHDLPVVLPVVFDGEDLTSAAVLCGTTPAGLVARVTGAPWRVAFGGFAPGFAYLVGGGLSVPRLESPRTRVPAGSVGLAGPYAGVYPRTSPGGWRLIGRLAEPAPVLFDPARRDPALLVPGGRVRFRAAENSAA